jgi:hypothetical protein
VVSLDVLLPDGACGADLSRRSIRVDWGPPGGLWAYPKCWASIRCRGDNCVGCIRDDESQVPQGASNQVSVNSPRVSLERISGGVDCLIIWIAIYCWEYRMREARYDVFDVFDSCVLNLYVLGGTQCLCALLRWKRFWTGVPKRCKCCLRDIALGSTVLVMTNELYLD